MRVALDTNVVVALWDADEDLNRATAAALDRASRTAPMVISAPVYAELLAGPSRTEAFLDRFLIETGIEVEWGMEEAVWRLAGARFQQYARRRRSAPRRILADFLIGAHAVRSAPTLLTLDAGLYRSAFPELDLLRI